MGFLLLFPILFGYPVGPVFPNIFGELFASRAIFLGVTVKVLVGGVVRIWTFIYFTVVRRNVGGVGTSGA